jgi:hypothetical protein
MHHCDEYGNDTLVVISQWNEATQSWKLTEKVEYEQNPLTSQVLKSLSYRWNDQLNAWLPSWHLRHYWNEYGQLDSLISFFHNDFGNVSYAYKILYNTSDQGLHRIGTHISLDVTTGEWEFYNRIETFLNEEGNIDLEITENWDETNKEFTFNSKSEYYWDSIGFDLILINYRWNSPSSNWGLFGKDERRVIDENGSTVRISQVWDANSSSWVNARRNSMILNQINRLIAFQGDNWDVVNQLWVPSFEANWEYNAETGFMTRFVDHQIWDTNTNNWIFINSETYEYLSDKKYSVVSKFNWDFDLTTFVLYQKDFYDYSSKELISDVPRRLQKPNGPDTICVNSEEVVYKSGWQTEIKSFDWKIIAEDAGTFVTNDSLLVLSLAENYTGSLGIMVAGVNGLGVGEYSDTLDVFIKSPPTKPIIPVGPEELNQFSGAVSYEIDAIPFANNYYWTIDPENAGILESDQNHVKFNLKTNYEGAFEISVLANNECGVGDYSDPLIVNAVFITSLFEDHKDIAIKIYPNPTSTHINISLKETGFINSIQIIDLNGKSVWESKTNVNSRDAIIHLNIPEGIYTMLFELKHGIVTKKIVVN